MSILMAKIVSSQSSSDGPTAAGGWRLRISLFGQGYRGPQWFHRPASRPAIRSHCFRNRRTVQNHGQMDIPYLNISHCHAIICWDKIFLITINLSQVLPEKYFVVSLRSFLWLVSYLINWYSYWTIFASLFFFFFPLRHNLRRELS